MSIGLRYVVLLTACLSVTGAVMANEASNQRQLPRLERKVLTVAVRSTGDLSVSIPKTALTSRNAVPGVFVVNNGRARFRMVRPGKSGARRVDILSGLFGHEVLIANRLDAVHDGSPITITNK